MIKVATSGGVLSPGTTLVTVTFATTNCQCLWQKRRPQGST